MAEPACLAISSRKARSGSQRISKRNPTSSHHRDRVHTLAPRPTRGIGFNGGTGATKKRPACARRSASVALFGHTPTTYMPECDDRSSHRQISWSTAIDLQRSLWHPVNPVTEGRRPARPPPAPGAASLGTNGRLAGMRGAGPHWVRTPSETAGPQRAPTVNLGMAESQVRRVSALQPRTAQEAGPGFESHLRTRGCSQTPPSRKGHGHAVWSRHSGHRSGFRPRSRVRWNSRPQLAQVRTSTSGCCGPTALGREVRGCGLSFAL
jgi:hypothetical protein